MNIIFDAVIALFQDKEGCLKIISKKNLFILIP